ncbi:hypothetical protein HMPREF2532_01598 [Bacteroides ovatus]|nr:hypothetical protein HMPREF2532_01598 [Bacteroides ovatus]
MIADKSADFYRTDVILPILFRRLLLYKNEVNDNFAECPERA